MTYKLYYADGTASMGVRVLLEEIGAPYQLIQTTTDRKKPRPAEQLKINPNGWVPVLLWDGGAMYECAAITIFLCDRHIEANLAPAIDAPERSLFLQTLIYFSSSVQTAFQLDYHAHMPDILTSLYARIGVTDTFTTFGLTNEEVENLADVAFKAYERDVECHPKLATHSDVIDITRKCL